MLRFYATKPKLKHHKQVFKIRNELMQNKYKNKPCAPTKNPKNITVMSFYRDDF